MRMKKRLLSVVHLARVIVFAFATADVTRGSIANIATELSGSRVCIRMILWISTLATRSFFFNDSCVLAD